METTHYRTGYSECKFCMEKNRVRMGRNVWVLTNRPAFPTLEEEADPGSHLEGLDAQQGSLHILVAHERESSFLTQDMQ